MPELDETHPALEQAPRHEALTREISRTVEIAHVLWLALDVEGIRGLALHAIGQLEAADTRLELRVVLAGLQMRLIDLPEKFQLFLLAPIAHVRVVEILDHLVDLLDRCVEVGSLESTGQKRRAPVFRALDRHAAGAERDVGGEVFIFATQSVGDPGAHGRTRQAAITAVHQHQRWFMIRHIRVHGADHAQVIGMARGLFEQLADLQSALTVALEGKGRAQCGTGGALGFQTLERDRLAVLLLQGGLGIKGVHLRGTAIHEQMHHAFRLRREVRCAGGRSRVSCRHKPAQCHAAESHAAAAQEIAAIEDQIAGMPGMMHGFATIPAPSILQRLLAQTLGIDTEVLKHNHHGPAANFAIIVPLRRPFILRGAYHLKHFATTRAHHFMHVHRTTMAASANISTPSLTCATKMASLVW